jgi:hypothetical protein
LLPLVSSFSGVANASDPCGRLWIERNFYYKEAGYYFRTADAINEFGNEGCIFANQDAVPLSSAVRARISQIVRLERQLGCKN